MPIKFSPILRSNSLEYMYIFFFFFFLKFKEKSIKENEMRINHKTPRQMG